MKRVTIEMSQQMLTFLAALAKEAPVMTYQEFVLK
jgi:hypothetical protein